MTSVPAGAKPGNRRLVTLFKGIIISVLCLPWIIAAIVAASFLGSRNDYSDELAQCRDTVVQLEEQKQLTQQQLDELEQKKQALEEELATANTLSPENTATSSVNGLNSASENTGPVDPQTEELAHDVILGNWGNGRIRVERLQEAGHDDRTIQSRVNEIIWNR